MNDGLSGARSDAGSVLGGRRRMKRNTIAVMNTKGGVGKSTLVLALAETLTALHEKTVLVIDSDAQASVSAMLMTPNHLHKLQNEAATIVDFLAASVLKGQTVDWTKFVVGNVSDVDDARRLYLIPSDMQLTLFEREVSRESQHAALRATVRKLLEAARNIFDYVLIDCPPGLSVLTETWLRDADWYMSPTKPDYVSVCGLEVFRRFRALNPEMGFAENIGVVINLADAASAADRDYDGWLRSQVDNRCFGPSVFRTSALQSAALYSADGRSWLAKYPGNVGQAVRGLTEELIARTEQIPTIASVPLNSTGGSA